MGPLDYMYFFADAYCRKLCMHVVDNMSTSILTFVTIATLLSFPCEKKFHGEVMGGSEPTCPLSFLGQLIFVFMARIKWW